MTLITLCAFYSSSQVAQAQASDINRALCPNELSPGFRAYLADCRAYELVTPSYKEGFTVEVASVSEDGSSLQARSFGIFSNPRDTSGFEGAYQIARMSSGWKATSMDAPFSVFTNFNVEATSPDLSRSLWTATAPSEPAIAGVYLATASQGPFELIGPAGPTTAGQKVLSLVGASRDFSHSLFRVSAPNLEEVSLLWPGDKTIGEGEPSLYEYAGIGNSEPRMVGVSNAGLVPNIAAAHLISECGTYLGRRGYAYNAVSESGDTIFFTALGRDHGVCSTLGPEVVEPSVNELYARLGASRTVAISEPNEIDCGECDLSSPADAEFQGASLDGSKVFFTTTQHLLTGWGGAGADLYEYDFHGPDKERVMLLSGGDAAGARVQKVVAVAKDGSHVYFTARGVLTTTANASGRQAEEGEENLYVYERDTAYPQGHVAFVATAGVGTAQVTPNGRFLVFESATDLTPDENEVMEAGQVFEYDSQTAALARVSRGQNGYNEDGNSSLYPATIPVQSYAQDLPVNEFTGLAMSDNGAYVFFTSRDSLTPQALAGAVNVYEYHEGEVALISDGHDFATSVLETPAVELVGTDGTGRDVYFRSADRLVPQDSDTQLDVYDARSEGGFPAATTGPTCTPVSICQTSTGGALPVSTSGTSISTGESPIPTSLAGLTKDKVSSERPKLKTKRKTSRKRRSHKKKRAIGAGR